MWTSWDSPSGNGRNALPNKEAQKVKAVIEHSITVGTFVAPTQQTVAEFLEDFVTLYGEKQWGVSMYTSSCALINNCVNPIIGRLNVQDVTSRTVDKYIQRCAKRLLSVPSPTEQRPST